MTLMYKNKRYSLLYIMIYNVDGKTDGQYQTVLREFGKPVKR